MHNRFTDRDIYTETEIRTLSRCRLCPRECGADRFSGPPGYCGADAGLNIASVCIHRGEEPPISGKEGICNIFFAGCNLRCRFCQNHEISRREAAVNIAPVSINNCLDTVTALLDQGIKAVGFVSPSHVVPQVKAIIRGLREKGYNPVTVYNTNGYDKAETIRSLDGYIDVYLPDYKYVTPELASEWSDAADYPGVVLAALREMYYQKGSVLHTDQEGNALEGILVRHLVMPGHAEESIKVIKSLAEELSPGISISLMSQYHPTAEVENVPFLNRHIEPDEYNRVVSAAFSAGFRKIWIQDPDSHLNYLPDFSREHPFEG